MDKTTILPILIACASLCSASCKRTEQVEATTAQITAAQMEGRKAARQFLNEAQSTDTVVLINSLLKARSKAPKYEGKGAAECSRAFDSTFVSTVRTLRPDIAGELERQPQ